MYYVGLDLGQRSDYTALAVVEAPVYGGHGWVAPDTVPPAGWSLVSFARRADRQTYALRHLHRFPLNTPYPEIVTHMSELMSMPPLAGRAVLLVDATGVGRPVVDSMRGAALEPFAVTITGGDRVTREHPEYRVPKRDLAMSIQILLQQRRLSFAAALPLLDVLRKELHAFEVKINPQTAHDSYLSWREGAHDDLVLAVAMATWAAELEPPLIEQPILPVEVERVLSWRG